MLKKSMLLLICCFTIIFTSFPVEAETIQIDSSSSEKFKNNIYNSDSYAKYKDYIDSVYVDRVAKTDVGIRHTLVYTLISNDESQMQLTYLGDENGNILENLLTISSDLDFSCINLKNNITTNINYGERGAAYICYKEVCSFYIDPPTFHSNDYGCSFFLGKSCDVLKLFGHPIAAILCKGGVWLACRISRDKVCAKFVEYQDVCTL